MVETDRGKLIKESDAEALRQIERRTVEDMNRTRNLLEEYASKHLDKLKFNYEHHKGKCSQCGRRILVQIVLDGSSHNMSVSIVCADCLAKIGVGEKFRKEHPEEAQDIEKWLRG